MEGFWPIFFLAVILKIPVIGAMLLVWWAVRAKPETEEVPPKDDHHFKRRPRDPVKPRDPRRGPHGGAAKALPDCPPGGRTRAPAVSPQRKTATRH
jgi:hypothetical protein